MARRYKDKFRPGQLVTWKTSADRKLKQRITTRTKEVGGGPFWIQSAKKAKSPKQTGHHQVLKLRHSDNFTRVFFKKNEWFSGVFFEISKEEN